MANTYDLETKQWGLIEKKSNLEEIKKKQV